ncbi:MAG TPA: nucleoside triphosphate pyrophosphohydrolase [Candidatus Cybelea sp.]|nr:nucleoside triphosphate pyrophosphohydrolase [Candidatus Cybelea sp.]
MTTRLVLGYAAGAAADRGETVRLLEIMRRLRDPERGCPWDREQSFATIAPYTIEEAYEVADAIERDDMASLKDELGDLLFQVVFHAQMAAEAGAFDFADVAANLSDKMERRHPHVFGADHVPSADAQAQAWEAHKAAERIARAGSEDRAAGVLDGIALGMPALSRAIKLQNRAARVGFDWPSLAPVLDKLDEELSELRAELAQGQTGRLEDELGDVLFVLANIARHMKIDPEAALRKCNGKFERRFRRIEQHLANQGKTPAESSLAEMDELWDRAKAEERGR